MRQQAAAKVDSAQVLTKAVLKAADLWDLKQDELAALLGTSTASVSRLGSGQRTIDPKKEYQLAALVVRVFRSLDSLMGGDSAKAASWLRSQNHHLRGVPLELMKSITGIVNVAEYLDGMRGKV